VGDDGLVVTQRASHERGGQSLAAILRSQGAIVNGGIGVLNKARQQAGEHGAILRLAESLDQRGDGRGRGHFAQIHAADSIGDGKQIAVRPGLLARGRDERPHRVFIVGADFAEIRCLTEL